jgi:hypothetical protein
MISHESIYSIICLAKELLAMLNTSTILLFLQHQIYVSFHLQSLCNSFPSQLLILINLFNTFKGRTCQDIFHNYQVE